MHHNNLSHTSHTLSLTHLEYFPSTISVFFPSVNVILTTPFVKSSPRVGVCVCVWTWEKVRESASRERGRERIEIQSAKYSEKKSILHSLNALPRMNCILHFFTGWRRLRGCLELQIIFRKRATNYRALLQKLTYEDTAPYESSPPCNALPANHSKNKMHFAISECFTAFSECSADCRKSFPCHTRENLLLSFVCVCFYIHTHTRVHIFKSMLACMCMCVWVWLCVHICACISACLLFLCACMWMYICLYIQYTRLHRYIQKT